MNKLKLKRLGALVLMSTIACGGTGLGVYVTMNVTNDKYGNDDQGEFDVPTIDDNGTITESAFSKAVNSLTNAKEIKDGNIAISVKPKNSDAIDFNLSSLNVDLSKLNSSVVNIASDLNVKYQSIDQSLSLKVEGNEYCYLTFKGKKFVFNAPRNLVDVVNLLQSLGILVPSTDEESSSLDLSSILSSMKNIVNDITVSNETIADDNSVFDITIPDIEIGNVKISSLNIKMKADKSTYSLKSISTNSDIVISKKNESTSSFDEMLSLSLNGEITLNEVSSYKEVTDEEKSQYKTVTYANSSVLSTISSIIGNGSDVKVNVSLDTTSNEETTHNEIDGLIQAKITKSGDKFTSSDFENGSYAISLNHLSDSTSNESLNSLYAYHSGNNTYLKFNDLIKAKASNTSLKDLFSLISEGSGKDAIEVISSQLNTTLGSLDIDSLRKGDLSQIQGFVNSENTYFDYDESTTSFVLSLDGTYFNLTSSPITISIKCTNNTSLFSTNGIQEIKVSGLNFTTNGKKNVVSVTLVPQKLTDFEIINESEYSEYKGTIPLFSTICDIISDRKFSASYSLYFNDRINDGTTSNFNKISANGKIEADLSKEGTNNEKLLRSFNEGDYHLSMNATTLNGGYNHNIDMYYQNQNFYFGFDSINKDDSTKDVTVFKNYISNAQLGEMKTLLDSKSESDVSSSLDSVDKVLSILGTSEEFKNDIEKIKKGSLKGLDSILSLSSYDESTSDGKTKNVIKLVINTDVIFNSNSLIGKNLGKITISLNSLDNGNSYSFSNIEIDTLISSDQEFSFSLSFDDYQDISLSDEEKSKYQKIDDFNTFTKAFYNLGNDIKKYGVKIDAMYKKNPTYENGILVEDGEGLSIVGSSYWNLENSDSPIVGGSLTISHPYVSINSDLTTSKTKADQNLKFKYQNVSDEDENKDGQFTLDYNDNMHVLMNSSTISDVVSTISNTSSTSILNNLLSTSSSVASSMPIKDVISQRAPSLLLDYPYIKKVEFNDSDNYIKLSVDKRLFNIDSEGDEVSLLIYYSDSDNPTITKIKAEISNDSDLLCYATISLTSYDENSLPTVLEYNSTNKNLFVDLNGFKNLVKMAIDTTEFNYYHLFGYLNLDLSLFSDNAPINLNQYSFDLNLDASIYIQDSKVYGYLSIKLGDKNISDVGYYVTEYAFKDSKVYISNTKTVASYVNEEVKNEVSLKAMRVSESEFKNNILYYLVSLGLDMDDRIAGKTIMANIYKTLSSKKNDDTSTSSNEVSGLNLTDSLTISLNSDFSSLLNAGTLYNEEKKKFTLGFNLDSLISVMVDDISLLDFDNTYLKIYHQSKTNTDGSLFTPFYAMQLSSEINVLEGLAKVSLKGQIVANANQGDYDYIDSSNENELRNKASMSRFYSLTDNLDKYLTDDYQISEITIKTKSMFDFTTMELVDFANDYSISDNSSLLTYSFDYGSDEYLEFLSSDYGFILCNI